MAPPNDTSDTPGVGTTIREARIEAGLGVRELSRQAGISHTQISRIEAGSVAKPSREALVALARALDRNPNPLLLLADHLSPAEGAQLFQDLFRAGSELREIWTGCSPIPLEQIDQLTNGARTDLDLARRAAADVFRVQASDETLWDDSYELAAARGEEATQLRELMGIWRFIGHRRTELLDYGRLLRRQADLEYLAESRITELEANTNPE